MFLLRGIAVSVLRSMLSFPSAVLMNRILKHKMISLKVKTVFTDFIQGSILVVNVKLYILELIKLPTILNHKISCD